MVRSVRGCRGVRLGKDEVGSAPVWVVGSDLGSPLGLTGLIGVVGTGRVELVGFGNVGMG